MKELLTQVLGLITFFAFPALQYVLLKSFSKQVGQPELWYLPAYGFRLVIRNIPGRRTLSEIRYRVLVRQVVPPGTGASVATWNEVVLLEHKDFFLFPGADEVLLSFRLERGEAGLQLLRTNKMGDELSRVALSEASVLIADYSANIENFLNFDVKLAKRVELKVEDLVKAFATVQRNDMEQRISVSRVREVG